MRRLIGFIFVLWCAAAQAQGIIAPGHVIGNGTSSSRTATDQALTSVIDQMACGSNNNILLRSGGLWGCFSFPSSPTAKSLLYFSSISAIGQIASGNSSVLVTDGSSNPSFSQTLPSAVQGNITALGTIATGVWNGTNIALANGGTNATLTASNGGIVYSTASAMGILAGTGTANQCLLSGSNAAPTWGSCSGSGAAVSSVTDSGGSTLTISPNTGAVLAGINLANANIWTKTVGISVNGGSAPPLKLNTPLSGQFSYVDIYDNGSEKWQIGKLPTNQFYVLNVASGHNNVQIDSSDNVGIVNGGGSVEIGGTAPNQLFTVANVFGADASGHPYCDPRAFGAGGGSASTDHTAIANALSTCSGGAVKFSCGNYLDNSGWTVGVSTAVTGQGEACVQITTSQTSGTVFTCGSSNSNTFEHFADFTINGPNSVPTSGYGIDCSASGNGQHYERVRVNGTFDGINVGGTNCTITLSRLENLYGTVMINEPNGGCQITHNQFDNDSSFNQAPCSTGTGGLYGVGYATYNRAVATGYAQGYIVTDGSYFYCATVGGTSAGAGALTPHLHGVTFTDGTVTWITIGNNQLILINVGTETGVAFNDMTSPAQYGILCDGNAGGKELWSYGNDIQGEIYAGIAFKNGCATNRSVGDVFGYIGVKGEYAVNTSGFPIWDQSSTDSHTLISGDSFNRAQDSCILIASAGWVVNGNSLTCNFYSANFYSIDLEGLVSGLTVGTNDIAANTPGAVRCISGSSRCTVVGNTVYGGAITLSGTNNVNQNNN